MKKFYETEDHGKTEQTNDIQKFSNKKIINKYETYS
jgi:hypothetical protein